MNPLKRFFSIFKSDKKIILPKDIKRSHFLNLNFASLADYDLTNGNLANAYLNNVCFDGALLEFSHFANSNIKKSSFQKSNLKYANFAGANLKETSFFAADLEFCNFKAAFCSYCDFSGSNLLNSNIESAESLVGAKFNEITKLPFGYERAISLGMVYSGSLTDKEELIKIFSKNEAKIISFSNFLKSRK